LPIFTRTRVWQNKTKKKKLRRYCLGSLDGTSISRPTKLHLSNPKRARANNFGKYLKDGVIEDDKNKKDVAQSGEEYTSLESYVEAMPEKQKSIYYVTGDGHDNAVMSPVIEKLKSRGFHVLLDDEDEVED
jgi:HSP90 family molecular chaperone